MFKIKLPKRKERNLLVLDMIQQGIRSPKMKDKRQKRAKDARRKREEMDF